jgi:hypothetical protein
MLSDGNSTTFELFAVCEIVPAAIYVKAWSWFSLMIPLPGTGATLVDLGILVILNERYYKVHRPLCISSLVRFEI